MSIKLDNFKWKLFKNKQSFLFAIGVSLGLVRSYDTKTLENWRKVYYGGIPASIILLDDLLCNGQCYDRALLSTLGFGNDDFKIVHAAIDGIKLQPRFKIHYKDELKDYNDRIKNKQSTYADHCFVERTTKDGKVWVYDTTNGLVWDKKLYYLLEHPKVRLIRNKQETMDFCEYQDILNANINNDKYAALLILPLIEKHVDKITVYQDALKEEIELYKKEIDFDGLRKEVDEDMKAKGYMR